MLLCASLCASQSDLATASLEHKQAAGDQLGQAVALLNLCRAQSAQGKFALARASAAQAGALYEAVGDARGEARAFLAQARLAKRDGEAEAARSLFQQAAERATTAGDAGLAGRAREELGRI